jgi:hypothetical protein
MYTRDGALVASMSQELLIRALENPQPQVRPGWDEGHPVHPE